MSDVQYTPATEVPSQRGVERLTGGLLIVYMVAVAVQVAARTASTSSGASFADSLATLAANHGLYLVSTSASLASSVLLIVLAAALYTIFRPHFPFLVLAASFLFLAAALAWLTSAASGLALTSLALELVSAPGIQADMIAGNARAVDLVRESTGRTGFTLAGLGTLSFGVLIAWKDALPKWLGWLGVVVGVLMLFIWNDSAAVLHRVGGTGYLLWLLLTGGWLLVRGSRAASVPG